MDSTTAAHRARERLITDRTNKISTYLVTNGGNWLGQVLKSMCDVVTANFDPHSSIQKRKRVVQDYLGFVAAPDFGPIAENDPAFNAVLAFAEIFGAFVDEMNERTIEGQSMPDRPESFGDSSAFAGEVRSNRAISMPAVVGDDSFTKLRATGGQGDQDEEVTPPSLGLVRSSFDRFASRRSSMTATAVAVGRKTAVDYDGGSSNQPGARKRARGDKVVAVSPASKPPLLTPSNHQKGVTVVAARRRSNEANFDSTASSVVACTVCGAMVKEGSMRRHMKGHAAGVGMEEGAALEAAAEPASLLDQLDTSSEEVGGATEEDKVEPQPMMLPLEQNMILNEFGLEEESADEDVMEVEERAEDEGDPRALEMDGWAADLYSKPASCFLCNKACDNYRGLSTHLYGAHKGFSQNQFAFQCLGCSHNFRSFTGALGHIQAAFRNQQVGCKNRVTFATASMMVIKEEEPEPVTPAAREAMEDLRSHTM